MKRKKQKLEGHAELWLDKLRRSYESATLIAGPEPEPDVELGLAAIRTAQEWASFILSGIPPRRINVAPDKPECFSCGAPTLERGGTLLHCSEACTALGQSVRYLRKKVDEQIDWRLDLLVGLGQNLFPWVSSGQPYDEKGRRVRPEARLAVFTRDGGKCVLCGAEATEIDHKFDSSGDMSNLQALCSDCNRRKMLAGLVPYEREEDRLAARERLAYFAELVAAPEPASPGFDHVTWNEQRRVFTRSRRQVIQDATFEDAKRYWSENQRS